MGPKDGKGLKEAYLANREAELKEWDAKILQLEARAEQAEAQVRILYYEQLEALRTKQTSVREKLHELKLSSGAAWESVKIGLENAWNDLRGGLTSAAAKFK
ncbi:MAG: coiled coil domain-containing protein [Planctomycetaceae bacterium]